MVGTVNGGAGDFDGIVDRIGTGWKPAILGRLIFKYIVVDRFDRCPAGDIAADMTAHAVGNQDQPQVAVDLK